MKRIKPTTMKKIITTTAFFFLSTIGTLSFGDGWGEDWGAFAQNISINGTGATAHSSAILDVSSPTLGLLIPRLPLVAINNPLPVTSPTLSLLVFNTATASTGTNAVSPGYYYWDGAKWVRFAYTPNGSSSEAWTIVGNGGTNPTTNFVGTTDAQDLVFRTNNLEAVRVTTAGNVGIGTNSPIATLHTLSNSYNIFDRSNPTLGSHLLLRSSRGTVSVPTAILNNGIIGTLSMGGFDGTAWTLANIPIEIVSRATENWTTGAHGAKLSFNITQNGNIAPLERMVINHDGNVGIGTPSPIASLDIHNANEAGYLTALVDVITKSALKVRPHATNSLAFYFGQGGTLGNTQIIQAANGIGTSSHPIALNPFGGNVGIGTDLPTSNLHVKSNLATNIKVEGNSPDYTNATIELIANGAGNARGTGMIMTDAPANNSWYAGRPYHQSIGTNDMFTINRQTAPTYFSEASAIVDGGGAPTGTQNFFTIRNNGNVGINTTAPTEKLEVQGSVKIVDGTQGIGKVLMSDASGKGSWQSQVGSWYAHLDGGSSANVVGGSAPIDFTSATTVGVGGASNFTTDQITVPATGLYRVIVSGYASGLTSPYVVYWNVLVNGGFVWGPHNAYPHLAYGSNASAIKVLTLNAGDVLMLQRNNSNVSYEGPTNVVLFSVELIK